MRRMTHDRTRIEHIAALAVSKLAAVRAATERTRDMHKAATKAAQAVEALRQELDSAAGRAIREAIEKRIKAGEEAVKYARADLAAAQAHEASATAEWQETARLAEAIKRHCMQHRIPHPDVPPHAVEGFGFIAAGGAAG